MRAKHKQKYRPKFSNTLPNLQPKTGDHNFCSLQGYYCLHLGGCSSTPAVGKPPFYSSDVVTNLLQISPTLLIILQ